MVDLGVGVGIQDSFRTDGVLEEILFSVILLKYMLVFESSPLYNVCKVFKIKAKD